MLPQSEHLNLGASVACLISLLALDTGEHLFAIDESRVFREARAASDTANTPTSIAVIPLIGSLRPRGSGSMASFAERVTQAAGNPDVGAIVLDIDSPGGTYAGTPEAASAVRAAAQVKPVTAMVDSLAASAAYWIASQASSIVMAPSADVGSIGVMALHLEISKALEDAGVKPTIMRSVPNKATGNLFEPLPEETKAKIMSDIATAHGEFTQAVASGRKVSRATVDNDFGGGFTMGAAQAVKSGMADRIGTMSDVLAGLRTKSGTIRRRGAFAF
jgi:signal peptide peptidase SppA